MPVCYCSYLFIFLHSFPSFFLFKLLPRFVLSRFRAANGPSVQQKALDALRHEVDVAVAAAGISVMGSIDHMSGGTFVVDSSSDSDGNEKSGIVYDVSAVTVKAVGMHFMHCRHWQSVCMYSLADTVQYFQSLAWACHWRVG